jgi:hypothetical protein
MAASNEIRFRIGADTSSLSRGFQQAQSVAAAAGKQLEKKFGLRDSMKNLVAGLGLDIARLSDTFARFFAGMPEWAEQAYQRTTAAAEQATQFLRGQIAQRQTLAQQLATLESTGRRDERAGGMKEQSTTQRILSQLPVAGAFFKNAQERKGVFSAEEIMAQRAEEQAAAQQRAAQKQALEQQEKDRARAERDRRAALATSQRQAAGITAVGSDNERYQESIRREIDLRREIKDQSTSAARAQQLQVEIDQEIIKQNQIIAKQREAERQTVERIHEVQRATLAEGETRAERILRLNREAADFVTKSADLSRSEDDRRNFRVQAAQRISAAAKEEYEWKVKAANLENSLKTPAGLNNTTTQGILARRASSARQKSQAARANGRFSEAVKQDAIADRAEERFMINDRTGMIKALGFDPRQSAVNRMRPLQQVTPAAQENAPMVRIVRFSERTADNTEAIKKSLAPVKLK